MNPDVFKRIGRPARTCLACGARIDAAGRHPSVLREQLDETPTEDPAPREDYCAACWAELKNDGFFSFWMARRDPPGISARVTRGRRNRTLLDRFVALMDAPATYADDVDEGAPAPAAGEAAPADASPFARRRPDSVLRLRRFISAHVLHQYHVLEWVEDLTAPDPRRAGRMRKLVRFRCAALDRSFDIEECNPAPEEIEAVRAEMRRSVERAFAEDAGAA